MAFGCGQYRDIIMSGVKSVMSGKMIDPGSDALERLVSVLGRESSLDSITHVQFKGGAETTLHVHRDLLHLAVVESGRGVCVVKRQAIQLVPGTVLFVYPNEVHSFRADERDPYCNYTVKIRLGDVLPGGLPRLLPGRKRFLRKLCSLLRSLLLAHAEREDIVRRLVEKSLLLQIFAELLRIDRDRKGIEMPSSVPPEFERTLELLQTPPFNFPGLDKLASMNGMGRRSFTSYFREVTGVSPCQFHENARLAFARKAMEVEGCGVKEAGLRCGYSNSQNFIRAYKRRFCEAPRRMLKSQTGPRIPTRPPEPSGYVKDETVSW